MVKADDFLYVFTRFLHIGFKAIEKERAALADKCKDMEKDMRKMIKGLYGSWTNGASPILSCQNSFDRMHCLAELI